MLRSFTESVRATGLVLCLLGLLLVRGFRSAVAEAEPLYRAVVGVLVAVTTYVRIFSAFNVSF